METEKLTLRKNVHNFVMYCLHNRFIRFLFVGGLNTLFGYSMFALLIFIGLHYAVASFIGTILGVLFNFKTTGLIVFRSRNNLLIFKFFGVYAVTYVFNVLWLKFFNSIHISNYIGGLILILPSAVLAFFLNSKFVFNENIKKSYPK